MSAFVLEKFLERIGLNSSHVKTADLSSLQTLVNAHILTVPFEQLDVALGRGVDPSVDAIFKKIVLHGRGGYCFENNRLMHEALIALGFKAKLRLARVLLGPSPSGWTHVINVVTIDGADYIVDVGFGRDSLRAPLPFQSLEEGTSAALENNGCVRRTGTAVAMGPDIYRLIDDCGEKDILPGGLRLQRFNSRAWERAGMPDLDASEGQCFWQDQYAFHPEQPVVEFDLAVGNHFVATMLKGNWFPNTRLAVQLTPTGRKILHADVFTIEARTNVQDLRRLFPSKTWKVEDGVVAAKGPENVNGGYIGGGLDDGKPGVACEPKLVTITKEDVPEDKWFELLEREFGVNLAWDYRTDQARETPIGFDDFLPGARGKGAPVTFE